MDGAGKDVREIRIIVEPRRMVLAALLAGLLFLAAVAGSLLLAGTARTEKASAYGTHNAGAKTWMFAEGYTGPGFEEYILVYNPVVPVGSDKNIQVRVFCSGNTGTIGYIDSPIIEPGQRWTVKVNEVCESFGYSGDVSVTATSILDPDRAPFICERAMYFTYQSPQGPVTGGSQVPGYQEGAAE